MNDKLIFETFEIFGKNKDIKGEQKDGGTI